MREILTESFKAALKDYLYLRSREYPGKPALKLVGDRFRLTGIQRKILFRGITPASCASRRRAKLIHDPIELKGKILYMDGFNVLYTIMNYMLGRPVFIGSDGILRDAGDEFPDIEEGPLFKQAMETLLAFIGGTGIGSLKIYLDGSTPCSEFCNETLCGEMKRRGVPGGVETPGYVDRVLAAADDGIVATSDSEIIDGTPCKIADAARYALEMRYDANIPDLSDYI
jgi:hypothetical protein